MRRLYFRRCGLGDDAALKLSWNMLRCALCSPSGAPSRRSSLCLTSLRSRARAREAARATLLSRGGGGSQARQRQGAPWGSPGEALSQRSRAVSSEGFQEEDPLGTDRAVGSVSRSRDWEALWAFGVRYATGARPVAAGALCRFSQLRVAAGSSVATPLTSLVVVLFFLPSFFFTGQLKKLK